MINVLMDLFHFQNQELMKFRKEYLDNFTIILFYFAWLTYANNLACFLIQA